MFVERYTSAVTSSNLQDDEHHSATHALMAAALADKTGNEAVLGSLLCRVKYADGVVHRAFEAGSGNLTQLLKLWARTVIKKGTERRWLPVRTEWDAAAAMALYKQVAQLSMAYWLDGRCLACRGATVTPLQRQCPCCKGSGKAEIEGGRLVVERAKDMVSELEGMYQSHGARAASLLRRAS